MTMLFFNVFVSFATGSPLYLGSAGEAPFSDSGQTGIVDLIVTEAFHRIGIQVVIISLPAERSLINANKGINDGDLIRVAGLRGKYPNLRRVPEKLINIEMVAFSMHVRSWPGGWEGLTPYYIGIVTGWKILEKKIDPSRLTRVRNRQLLFNLLVNNRVDLVIYERFSGYKALSHMKNQGIHVLDPPVVDRAGFLYLHKKHRVLVPLVAESLKGMKADGTYSSIVDSTVNNQVYRVKKWVEE